MSSEINSEADHEMLRCMAGVGVGYLVVACYSASADAGWWTNRDGTQIDPKTPYLVAAKLMLAVSELAEAMEGDRKDMMDDHLPHRQMIEVELADAIIRIADLAGALELDLGGAVREKLEYNAHRADHKRGHRDAPGGKAY